ncbi:MAG: SAM-dependent methyltransferase, partial [Desulfococcaceae bacterium]
MKRRSSKKQSWADHYARKAQKDNYPARSVYKLQEIQKKTGVLHKGDRVLDLGCAPGSWLLYAAELVGPE